MKEPKKYDLEALCQQLVKLKGDEKQRRQDIEEKWERAGRGYNCIPEPTEDGTYETDNQMVLPLVLDAVEELYSQLFRALFPTTDNLIRIDCDPRINPAAEIIREFMQKKIRRDNLDDLRIVLKQSALTGNAFCRVFFERTIKKIHKYDYRSGKYEASERQTFMGVKAAALRWTQWMFESDQPFGEGVFMLLYQKSLPELKSGEKLGLFFNIDQLSSDETESQNGANGVYGKQWKDPLQESQEQEQNSQNDELNVPRSSPVEIFDITEYWGDIWIYNKDKGEHELFENHRVIIADDKIVIGCDANPNMDGSLPGVLNRFMLPPDPGAFLGTTVILKSLDIFHGANKIWNILFDLAERTVKSPQTYDNEDAQFVAWKNAQRNSGGGKVKIRAGTLIPSKRGLKALENNNSGLQIGFTTVGEIVNRFTEATKSIKNFSSRGYEKTATEIAGIMEQVSGFMAELTTYHQDWVVRFFEKWWNVYIQNVVSPSPAEAIEDMNKTLKYDVLAKLQANGLGPEDLFQDWDFQSTGNNYHAIRQRRIQLLMQIFSQLAPIPGTLDRVKGEALLKFIAKEMELAGFSDVLMTDEEFAKKVQEAKTEAQQQQAAMIQAQKDIEKQKFEQSLIQKNPGAAMLLGMIGGEEGGVQPGNTEEPPAAQ